MNKQLIFIPEGLKLIGLQPGMFVFFGGNQKLEIFPQCLTQAQNCNISSMQQQLFVPAVK